MRVTVNVPEDIARRLMAGATSPGRAALEGLAAEGYRSGALTECEVMRLLKLESRFAVHEWLRARQIPYHYTEEDLATDLDNLSALRLR